MPVKTAASQGKWSTL